MYYCSEYSIAVLFCVVCMFCWGSWGNTQKLAGKSWRYELFYWDYVIGLLLFSLVAGLTLGSSGAHPEWGFLFNLKASFGSIWLWPFFSGVVFNLSNILLSASIAVAGMSVAFPVGVGLALVGGTIFNYFVKSSGDPAMMALGLALIVISIICNALAFRFKTARTANPESRTSPIFKGLLLAIAAGLLMMWFSPLVNKAIDLTFAEAGHVVPVAGMMTPYTAFFVFSVGIFLSNFLWNTIAMKKPVSGEPIAGSEWFRGSVGTHSVGMLGGAIWGLGTLLSFVTVGAAGPAIAYALGQGATLVSALWGILIWREFKGAPKLSHGLNLAMFLLFIAGLAALIKAGA